MGSSRWPLVPLDAVLALDLDRVPVDPTSTYEMAGVYSFGRGLFRREPVFGGATSYRYFYRLKPEHVVMSQLFGWEGALALSTEEFAGVYVSPQFPTFLCDSAQLDRQFLGWIMRRQSFWADLAGRTKGMGDRRRTVDPGTLLRTTIPLPPLVEQRRIVARFVQAEGLIRSASRLFSEMTKQAAALVSAEELRIWPESALARAPTLRGVTSYLARGRQSHQGASEHHLIKTRHVQMGRYVPTTVTLSAEAAAKVDPAGTVRSGDVLIACSAAGCLGRVAMFEEEGRIASTDTHVAVARPAHGVVLPEYLYAYLRGAQGQVQLRSRERGDWQREKVGFRLTELNLRDLEQVPVPVPSLSDQRRVVARITELRSKLEELERHQQAQVHRLGNLLVGLLSQAFGVGEAGPGEKTH